MYGNLYNLFGDTRKVHKHDHRPDRKAMRRYRDLRRLLRRIKPGLFLAYDLLWPGRLLVERVPAYRYLQRRNLLHAADADVSLCLQ